MLPLGSLPFKGTVWTKEGLGFETEGHYRRFGEGATLRFSGNILVPDRNGGLPSQFNPFRYFGVFTLRGRVVNIEIPGQGLFPAQLFSDASTTYSAISVIVDFHGWCPPIPRCKPRELAEALRTPIYDALLEGGHYGLAELALASAVALAGWPSQK